ncbi:MAG TPA: hypothetical protein VFW15_05895, partial [Thermoanaerobaculia bacterium]|nr:hypothetical protein [Thermoanaerobaculia bacterium]
MIMAINLNLGLRRLHLRPLAGPLVAVLNGVAETIDGHSSRLRSPGQGGTLFANFHVVAEVAK